MEAELMVNITEHEVRVWAEREGAGRGGNRMSVEQAQV